MTPSGTDPAAAPEPFTGLEVATVSSDTLRAGIRVDGDLGTDTAALLTSVLRAHLSAGRRYLRVDLARAGILGGAVIETLVDLHTEVAELGGMLVFENAGPHVMDAVASARLFVRGPEH